MCPTKTEPRRTENSLNVSITNSKTGSSITSLPTKTTEEGINIRARVRRRVVKCYLEDTGDQSPHELTSALHKIKPVNIPSRMERSDPLVTMAHRITGNQILWCLQHCSFIQNCFVYLRTLCFPENFGVIFSISAKECHKQF